MKLHCSPETSALPVLISHLLCPYVQRAAIVLAEKGVAFERRDIDLARGARAADAVDVIHHRTDRRLIDLFDERVALDQVVLDFDGFAPKRRRKRRAKWTGSVKPAVAAISVMPHFR
jgi:hypothetical protein